MSELKDKDHFHISDEAFDLIRSALLKRSGFNLDRYKDKCIRRRIGIRVRATHCKNAEEYGDLLTRKGEETDHLLKVLTIHVSQFFRNPSTFEKLKVEIIPKLLERRDAEGRGLTFWSVGCASGEEPYSLALILKEFFPRDANGDRIRILATDVDANILETAKEGIYGEERLVDLPGPIRERWFLSQGGKFHLMPEIKELVDFERRDLCVRETFPDCDLILCRNVLIYFERVFQERILNGFADVLGRGGILVMGKSETLFGAVRSRFQTVCPIERVYTVV